MSTTARTITATDPVTGKVYSRRTEADYTHASIRDGKVRFHGSLAAAARAGRAFPVDGSAAPAADDAPDVDPDATCTVVVDAGARLCGQPAVLSFTSRRHGRLHECSDHAR